MLSTPGALLVTLVFIFGASFSGCSTSYSLREESIRSSLPSEYSNYSGGIVASPTDADVKAAIDLGGACKEKPMTLEYAYLAKGAANALSSDVVYVDVLTPLHLISKHALEEARDYHPVEKEYVEFLRGLQAVALTVNLPGGMLPAALGETAILVRDGVRVPLLTEVPAWQAINPFEALPDKATFAPMREQANQLSRSYTANFNETQKRMAVEALLSQGYTHVQITESTGFSLAEVDRLAPATFAHRMVPVRTGEMIFSIEELKKPGKYEVVLMQTVGPIIRDRSYSETRIPIEFSSFR